MEEVPLLVFLDSLVRLLVLLASLVDVVVSTPNHLNEELFLINKQRLLASPETSLLLLEVSLEDLLAVPDLHLQVSTVLRAAVLLASTHPPEDEVGVI